MGVLNSFFARGWGIRPSKKLPGGFARGGDGQARGGTSVCGHTGTCRLSGSTF